MKSKKSIVLSDNKVALIVLNTARLDTKQTDKIKSEFDRLEKSYKKGDISEEEFFSQNIDVTFVSKGESCEILRASQTFSLGLSALDIDNIHKAMSKTETVETINIFNWVSDC